MSNWPTNSNLIFNISYLKKYKIRLLERISDFTPKKCQKRLEHLNFLIVSVGPEFRAFVFCLSPADRLSVCLSSESTDSTVHRERERDGWKTKQAVDIHKQSKREDWKRCVERSPLCFSHDRSSSSSFSPFSSFSSSLPPIKR